MRVYRVKYDTVTYGSGGFSWHANRAEAEQMARLWNRVNRMHTPQAEVEPVDFETTKAGVLRLLGLYATHNDNG